MWLSAAKMEISAMMGDSTCKHQHFTSKRGELKVRKWGEDAGVKIVKIGNHTGMIC